MIRLHYIATRILDLASTQTFATNEEGLVVKSTQHETRRMKHEARTKKYVAWNTSELQIKPHAKIQPRRLNSHNCILASEAVCVPIVQWPARMWYF